MRNIVLVAAVVSAAAPTPASAQTMTVQSLLDSGYTVAGIATSSTGGASLYLQKGNALVYCFAAETPDSLTLATKYCKPVK